MLRPAALHHFIGLITHTIQSCHAGGIPQSIFSTRSLIGHRGFYVTPLPLPFQSIPIDDMGKSLSRAASLTTEDAGAFKLEFFHMNETVLTEILCFVGQLSSQHPQEADQVFNEPLEWRTTLVASDFITNYDISGSDVQSHEKDSEGHPLLQLSPPTVYVRNFKQLSKLVDLADKKKLDEIRACLEENKDPLVKIFGHDMVKTLKKEDANTDVFDVDDEGKEGSQKTNSEVKVRLFYLLQNIEKLLIDKLVTNMSKQVRLDPTAVINEVKLLKKCCSKEKKRLLKCVRYTSDYVFPNGCRAPLWRQMHGEMCYLIIEPYETENLYITCSKEGVFLNGGIKEMEEETGYEQTSEIFVNLIALLQSKVPHFAEIISKQDFAAWDLLLTESEIHHLKSVDTVKQCQPLKTYKHQENIVDMKEWQHVPTETNYGKKYKPCLKWKNLGLICPCGEAEERTPFKCPGDEKSGKIHEKPRFGAKMKAAFSLHRPVSSQKFKMSAGVIPEELLSESSSESEGEEEQAERHLESNTDRPAEYWQIQKLVKYLKGGDQTATLLILCAMMDFNLMQETCQLAIQELGGLEVLINLLDTDEVKCKTGSLKILRKICHNVTIRQNIVDMGGLQSIVKILDSPIRDLQALAAETIANIAKFRRARRTVRQHGGIQKLVKLLDRVPNLANFCVNQEKDVYVACCGALALWSCSKSTKNKEAIRMAGGIPRLGHLLKSQNETMLIPVVGTLQECASEESYRIAIQTEGMIKDLVRNLCSNNDELQMHCATAIFKCAEDSQTRELVRKYKGLQPLVLLLNKAHNKQLLAAATGAIWKCSVSMENVTKFQEYKALETLVSLLTDQPEEVLVNVVGALGEFAQISANTNIIRKCGGIKPLVTLLTGTNQALLMNLTKAVGACAGDKDNMILIDQLDGVRLVWSLLKNPCPGVQSSAAWALCPCIENAKDAGEMVRSLVGGLELIVNLLKSRNNEVLASICAVIAKIAKDKENLAVLTDHGVVPLLANLTNTSDAKLRHHLADAINHCCIWGSNRFSFGVARAVAPLVCYLNSKDSAVHRSTSMALYQLSKDPNNCITMHERKVVKPLIDVMDSNDKMLQEAAAACVRNIRLLALANRKMHLLQ